MGPETPMSSCKWQDLFSCSKWYITKNDNFYLTLSALTFNIHFISITLINSAAIDSQNAQLHVNKKNWIYIYGPKTEEPISSISIYGKENTGRTLNSMLKSYKLIEHFRLILENASSAYHVDFFTLHNILNDKFSIKT